MACKMIVAAAACVLILSSILPSGVEAVDGRRCKPRHSRLAACVSQEACKDRCQSNEDAAGGFCDANNVCICIITKCASDDDELHGGKRLSPLPAPGPWGATANKNKE